MPDVSVYTQFGTPTDIRKATLMEGDWLYLIEELQEYALLTEIRTITITPTGRKLTLAVQRGFGAPPEASEPGMLATIEIANNSTTPIKGVHIPKGGVFSQRTPAQQGSIALQLLWSYLENKPNGSATYQQCLDFLTISGFKATESDARRRNALSRIIRSNPNVMKSAGGKITLLLPSIGGRHEDGVGRLAELSQVKVVNWEKFSKGMRLLLESGLFGEVAFIAD